MDPGMEDRPSQRRPPPSQRLTPTFSDNNSGSGWFGTGPAIRGNEAPPFGLAVLAGGCASSAVDVAIFPLDTIKTRLQSPLGFHASGGYRGLFSGVTAAALGAAPGGALFFGMYEYSRLQLMSSRPYGTQWITDATAACVGATASCVLRNPAVVVQQRMQVGQYEGLSQALRGVASEGGVAAFYSGLRVSIAREIPFAFIQFPMYEWLKRLCTSGNQREITPSEGALCGSIAGSVAAAATTPLDLLKTRQMLGHARQGLLSETLEIVQRDGVAALFSGFAPRVGWMALGGCIFFGVYEQCMALLLGVYRPRQMEDEGHNTTGAPAASSAALPAASSDASPPCSASRRRRSRSRRRSPCRSSSRCSRAAWRA